MGKLLKSIKISRDGINVETIPAGEYKELPELAINHAKNLEVLEGEVEVNNELIDYSSAESGDEKETPPKKSSAKQTAKKDK